MTPTLPGAALDPAAYAVDGRPPRAAVRPDSREELSEALRAAAADRLATLPWGGGTSAPRDGAPERYDLALDLTALDRIVEYDPEDLTITVECGITLAALGGALAARGQELPVEGGDAGRATLGGALAANASGPRRLRFGAPRDRLLGARFALAGGTIARTGGRVVKNVTGHAVHRLLCGSRGALAAFVEASLKLVPAPGARRALVFHADAKRLADPQPWAALPRLEPAAVTVLGSATARSIAGLAAGLEFTVVVVLEDDAPWVERQTERIESALGTAADRLEGAAVAALLQALGDAPERWQRRLTYTTAWNSPAALGVWQTQANASELVFHSLAGRLHLGVADDSHTTEAHRPVESDFTLVEAQGFGPPAWSTSTRVTPLNALRRRIRSELDPAGLWARGPEWERGGA